MNLKEVQRKLALLCFYPFDQIDGQYGKKTQAALDDFKQKYKVLDDDVDAKLSEIIQSMRPDSSDTFTDKLIKMAKGMGATLEQVAYILATIKHETNGSFKPVEEAYWLSTGAREKYLNSKPYGVKWAGRGYVQTTWFANYNSYETLLNVPFTTNPDLMLDPDLSLLVCVHGMMTGVFTGKKLSDYIGDGKKDYVEARRIVNGRDDQVLIASYADTYEAALFKGGAFK